MRYLVCLTLLCCAGNAAFGVSGSTLAEWGRESLTNIERDFRVSGALYAHSLTERFRDYAWGQGVMANALVAAAKVDRSYLPTAVRHADEFHQRYWCTRSGTSGYNASSGNCGDRYYDDNAWIALALMELYELTEDTKYLTWARETVVFCMTGENGPQDNPNGGIRWHESNTGGASVCSTAPTILANLMIYHATGIESYLTDGRRLYEWLVSSNLRYSRWIFHETNEGPLGYQTAVMTQAAVLLYRLTGEDRYLWEAQVMGAAMEHEFINKDTHALKQTGKWGGHDMTNAYVDLYEVDRNRHWLNIAAGYLEYLYVNGRDAATGRYPLSWDRVGVAPSNGLIDNASAARAFWKMAGTVGGAGAAYVNIRNRAAGRSLRVFASQTMDGTNVVLYDYSATSTSQMFTFTDQGNGYFTIRSWSADKALEPYNKQTADNTNVAIYPADARGHAQQWRLIDLGNGYFNIQNRLSGKSLEPRLSGTANNTPVVTNTTDAGRFAQQWQLTGYTAPTSITAYVSMDQGGRWDQTDRVTADGGDSVMLKGEAAGDGTWQWTGPRGFSASGSVVALENVRSHESGNYVVTFTNAGGAESYSVVHVRVAGGVKLFQHCNYSGWMADLGVGAYTTADLAASGVLNNDASSIKVAPGYRATLFDYNNFQGPTLVRTSDDICLVGAGWNDRLTSLIIEGEPVAAAHWRFDEGGGTTIFDASGHGRNGTLVNMDEFSWEDGKRCGGLWFDGIDDSVRITGYAGIPGDLGRTCMAWIKTTQVSGEILSWGRETRARRWVVRVDESGRLRVEIQGGYAIGTTLINDGLWHHVAVVIEDYECADIADVKLYVDGRLDTLSVWGARPVNTEAARDVRIGAFLASQRYFEGTIDEVRIYARPLNSRQIWRLFLEDALLGDSEPDGDVDVYDFAALAERWLDTDSCDRDLNCDGSVDMKDFAILAGEWLRSVK